MNKKAILLSPMGIFFIYTLSCGVAIMILRFIFPAEAPPLPYFSIVWRINGGLLHFLAAFPALAISALVIPFGFKIHPAETISSFSPKLFLSLKSSIVTAIAASVLYAVLFFLAFPLARDQQTNLRLQGNLYNLARHQAQQHALSGEWAEAAQLLEICDKIWPDGYQATYLQEEAQFRLQQRRAETIDEPRSPITVGPQPLDVIDALNRAHTAMAEERFFDAHWLATIGERLARPGSPELAATRRLASIAWDEVNSLAPTAAETEAFEIFAFKQEGYISLNAQEWIRAYYIFLQLLEISPADPDIHRFFAMSVEGLRQTAFFIDEMSTALGRILTGAVFSLPLDSGRAVLRFSSLSILDDTAYGTAAEILAFDRDGQLLWRMETPYVKIMPFAARASKQKLVVLLRALDRLDETRRWQPNIHVPEQPAIPAIGTVGGNTTVNETVASTVLALPISWDDFTLLSHTMRGLPELSVTETLQAAARLGDFGHKPELFQTELIRRFSEPALLLILGIFSITLGWRLRSFRHPAFLGILMLVAMPIVFYAALNLCRILFSHLALLAVLSLGFITAALALAAFLTVLLALLLIILASQRG